MRIVIALVVGILAGLMFVGIAIGMAGGGHGWCSPLRPSLLALIAFPALALACAHPSAPASSAAGIVVLMALVLADFWLKTSAGHEGSEYYEKVVRMAPNSLKLWYSMWGAAHVVASVLAVASVGRIATYAWQRYKA